MNVDLAEPLDPTRVLKRVVGLSICLGLNTYRTAQHTEAAETWFVCVLSYRRNKGTETTQ
jgi:hypothetical protein